MGVRMLHEQADNGEGGPGGLQAAAAAGGFVVGVEVLEGADADRAEVYLVGQLRLQKLGSLPKL